MSELLNFLSEHNFDFTTLPAEVEVKENKKYWLVSTKQLDLKDSVFQSTGNLQLLTCCNGTIISKETKKIVCYGLPRSYDYTEYIKVNEINVTEFTAEPCMDGTVVRLFYNGTEWQVSTTRTFDAKKAYWTSTKSIYQLFFESCPFLVYSKLNTNYCYTFVVLHPEHLQVIPIKFTALFHLSTRDLTTLQELPLTVDTRVYWSYKVSSDPEYQMVPCPTPVNFTQLTELQECDFSKGIRGYILKKGELRLKVDSEKYKEMAETRGSNRDLLFRYLELLGDPVQLNKFVLFYQDYNVLFQQLEYRLHQTAVYIQDLYYRKYIKKENIPDTIYTKTLNQLHGQYKYSIKFGLKQDTSQEVVLKKLKSLSPSIVFKLLQ